MNKELTSEALDVLEQEGTELYTSIDQYINFIFSQTNFHDGMIMLNVLAKKLDDYILTQDEFYFIADEENIYLDIEEYFSDLDFEGEIFEN